MRFVDHAPAFVDCRKRSASPKLIVIHHTCTATPEATVRALKAVHYSTHYEVAQDGTIHRYLDPAFVVAYHAAAANQRSIGIDVTHVSGAAFPEPQILAVRELVQALRLAFAIPMVAAPDGVKQAHETWIARGVGVVRHRNLAATACPEAFPIERLV